MVTIKEVAKLAGVSHGTVSNVINGATNVSVDKIQKVKAAMKELGYQPNVTARNMKIEHTREVNLVVPNIENQEYVELYESLNRCANENHYFINLKVTGEVPTEERRLLNEALMRNVESVILVTCQPDNTDFFNGIIKNGLHIIFAHHEVPIANCHYVGFDVRKTVKEKIRYFIKKGYRNIAVITGAREYSFEEEVCNSYFMALCDAGIPVEPDFVESCNFREGSAFRASMRVLNGKIKPQVILVSNAGIEKSVKKAIDIVYDPQESKPELIIMKPYDWGSNLRDEAITLPFHRLAEEAFRLFLGSVQSTNSVGERCVINVNQGRRKEFVSNGEKKGTKLRILLNESPSSHAIELLLQDFEKKTGINVELVTRQYTEMFEEIWSHKEESHYDLYSIDFPWLKDLVKSDSLDSLDDLYEKEAYRDYFTKDILEKSSEMNGLLYSIPYSFTIQLLFYRKDLFNKLENQRLYYEWYKEDLKVPENWEEFNKVAKLFTKQYNPISDTKYGVTLGGRKFSGAVNEFLPRMYAFGGNIIKNGKISIADKASVDALDNYVESYQYANPKAVDWWWDEQVEDYCKGDAAMMIMYTEHVSALEDRRFSKVVGKTQAAVLPGKYSVLGGWSLGLNKQSQNKEAAYEFLRWVTSYELLGPNAALGRVLPCSREDYRAMLGGLYSWIETAWEAYAYTKPREVPQGNHQISMTEAELEEILGTAVHDAVICQQPAKRALEIADKKLKKRV